MSDRRYYNGMPCKWKGHPQRVLAVTFAPTYELVSVHPLEAALPNVTRVLDNELEFEEPAEQ